MLKVSGGRTVAWCLAVLHGGAAAAAWLLPAGARGIVLAGIVLSLFAAIRQASRPLYLSIEDGRVSGRLSERPDEPPRPVRVVPFPGCWMLVLQMDAGAPRPAASGRSRAGVSGRRVSAGGANRRRDGPGGAPGAAAARSTLFTAARCWAVARRDLPESSYRELLISARWGAYAGDDRSG